MNINFNLKNVLKQTRERYVKEFKVSGEIKIEPCGKFVACLEKLSKNYVLALKDSASIEALQVANQNDIEFYEGYEIIPQYTDDLRRQLCDKVMKIIVSLANIIGLISEVETGGNINENGILNDMKLDFNVIKSIIENIYKHLTMTNNIVLERIEEAKSRDIFIRLKDELIGLINQLIDVKSKLIIDYIVRQIDMIIDKVVNHTYKLENLIKK
jgi:hypothetical protein